jgi:hypothetical protein
MNIETTIQAARRATSGRSVLGWVALVCLILNGAFWGSLMLDLLAPTRLLSPQTIQAGLSIAAFALVLPLAWSSMLPNSPAMRLLQRQSWNLPGQLAISAAAVFLTWLAGSWLHLWWQAQPTIAESGNALFLTITSLIAGTLVPALAWAAMTPEQWVAAVEQARQVKRLEWALKMEETTMRAYYARAIALLNAGLSNLTIDQRKELAGILGGFARAQQHALDQVADSWREMYGVDVLLGTVDDQQLIDQYKTVADMLTEGADAAAGTALYIEQAPSARAQIARPNIPHQDTAEGPVRAPSARAVEPAQWPTSGPPVAQSAPTARSADDEALAVAQASLRGAWKRAEVEQLLSISKTQALNYVRRWLAAGLVISLTEPKDHYTWREVQ